MLGTEHAEWGQGRLRVSVRSNIICGVCTSHLENWTIFIFNTCHFLTEYFNSVFKMRFAYGQTSWPHGHRASIVVRKQTFLLWLVKGSQLDTFCPKIIVYCYIEFKLRYLKNLKLFSIRIKVISAPIVL